MKVDLLNIDELHKHEKVIHDHLHCLCDDIRKNNWIYPIIVDMNTKVILDGHHRYSALKRLKYKKIPCIQVDYLDESIIELDYWQKDFLPTKLEVISCAKSGKLFPPKTTKHIIKLEIKKSRYQLNELK